MTTDQNIQLIADAIQQVNNFLLLSNICIQITLGFLLGYKLGAK